MRVSSNTSGPLLALSGCVLPQCCLGFTKGAHCAPGRMCLRSRGMPTRSHMLAFLRSSAGREREAADAVVGVSRCVCDVVAFLRCFFSVGFAHPHSTRVRWVCHSRLSVFWTQSHMTLLTQRHSSGPHRRSSVGPATELLSTLKRDSALALSSLSCSPAMRLTRVGIFEPISALMRTQHRKFSSSILFFRFANWTQGGCATRRRRTGLRCCRTLAHTHTRIQSHPHSSNHSFTHTCTYTDMFVYRTGKAS